MWRLKNKGNYTIAPSQMHFNSGIDKEKCRYRWCFGQLPRRCRLLLPRSSRMQINLHTRPCKIISMVARTKKPCQITSLATCYSKSSNGSLLIPFSNPVQCKYWNSLITSNDFISAHLNFTELINQNGTPSLLIRYFDRTRKIEQYIKGKDDETLGLQFSNIEFQYASKTACFRVVGYCDGVVCLSDDLFDSMYMVILWNPSIRKFVRVSIPNYEQTWPQGTVLGFGVCPRTHDPKVIRIVYVNVVSLPHLITIEDPPLVEVFSLSSGAWRKPFGGSHNLPYKTIQITWSQVCFNGVVLWVACDERIEADHRCLIMSFDLAHEMFDEMSLPDALAHQHVSNLSISNRREHLTMLEYDKEKGKEFCGVWVLKEQGVTGSWEKLYIIRLPGLLRKAVGFRMNGDMVLALKNHELVFVECTGNVKSLGIYANIRSFFLGSYMESLILINHPDQ